MSDLACVRPLVTGGAGFIGSHLVDALLARGAERVVVVDSLFLGDATNLEAAQETERLVIYREDAGDRDAMASVCDHEQPDVVFNLATKALLYSFFNPPGACRVNLDIALTLAELLREGRYERLVHLSSSEVYGSAVEVPMGEDHPLRAETTYAAGKAAADLALLAYARMFGSDLTIVRPFNNYGPRQNEGRFAAVVPQTIRRVREGQAPEISGDGTQTRDFTYVEDTVDAVLRLAARPGLGDEVVNLGSGRETSIGEIVTCVAELAGWTGPIEQTPARPADVMRHCADVGRAESHIGPIAQTPLREGLEATVKWFADREAISCSP